MQSLSMQRIKYDFDPMKDTRLVYELDKNVFNGNVSLANADYPFRTIGHKKTARVSGFFCF